MTAGQIIPAVTGTSWDDYMQQRIFKPLGMTHSNVSNAQSNPATTSPTRIRAWTASSRSSISRSSTTPGQREPSIPAPPIWPNGYNCNSTMASSPITRATSSPSSVRKEMWSPQTILPTGDPPPPLAALKANFADYALGWGLRDYHGRKLVGHTGGVGGFVSRVMLVPEENLGVVVLTNAEQDGAFDSILYHVLDHYFHLPPTDWIAAFKSVKDTEEKEAAETMKKAVAARAADSKPSLPLEKYAGVYNDAWYGPITIRMENGRPGHHLRPHPRR